MLMVRVRTAMVGLLCGIANALIERNLRVMEAARQAKAAPVVPPVTAAISAVPKEPVAVGTAGSVAHPFTLDRRTPDERLRAACAEIAELAVTCAKQYGSDVVRYAWNFSDTQTGRKYDMQIIITPQPMAGVIDLASRRRRG
jgi:hypothetical protein